MVGGGGYTVYLIMSIPTPLVSVPFGSLIPNFCSFFVNCFFILVFVSFFRFLKSHKGENNIRALSNILPSEMLPRAREEVHVFQKCLDRG